MGLQRFYAQGPHLLLWAGSQAARGKVTVSGMSNCPNNCVIFIVIAQLTNVVAGRIIQPGGPRFGDPCSIP